MVKNTGGGASAGAAGAGGREGGVSAGAAPQENVSIARARAELGARTSVPGVSGVQADAMTPEQRVQQHSRHLDELLTDFKAEVSRAGRDKSHASSSAMYVVAQAQRMTIGGIPVMSARQESDAMEAKAYYDRYFKR